MFGIGICDSGFEIASSLSKISDFAQVI